MSRRRLSMCLVPIISLAVSSSLHGEDWPQWRGPERRGITSEAGLLKTWEFPPPVVWRADGIGDGYASVVIGDGRVFTMSKQGADVHCVALDLATGKKLWSQLIGNSARHAMSTPTYHDGFVYPLDPDGELSCLAAASGDIVWKKDLFQEYGGQLMSGRGYGESPLIDGNRLICTPGGAESMLVALDRKTGTLIWKAAIPALGPKGRDGACFASAVVTEAAGKRQIVQLIGRGLVGIEAETGRFLWGYNDICNGVNNIPTPVVRGDLVFSANGYNAGSVLLKLEPGGDTGVTAREVYRLRGTDFQNHHGGVMLVGDYIFGGHGSNNGLPTCIELATGRIVWKRRGPGTGSAATAAADGHLVFRYQNGVVAWIEASPDGYSLAGTFEIPGTGGDSWSHPVIAHGKLFLREQSSLWVHDLVNPGSATAAPPTLPLDNLPPEVAAVRSLGATVERLPFEEKLWNLLPERKRLYRFTIADKDNEVVRPILITASDDHITPDGQLLPELIATLSQIKVPLILSIGETRFSDAGLKQIAALETLRGLNVELCVNVTDAGFAHLAEAKRLRVLTALGTGMTENGLQPLAKLPHLVALDLEVCDQVTDAACAVLAEFPALRALNVKKTAFEPVRITPVGIAHLARLSKLEVLNLYGNDVTDDVLSQVGKLAALRELNLSLVGVTDQGLAHLKDLPNLRRLHLLYSVGFAGPMVTDAGLRHLNGLPRLQILDLTGARVTDAGLMELVKVSTLRQLELSKTQITAQGIQQFQALHPKCRIRSFVKTVSAEAKP